MKLVFATNNPNKIREVNDVLGGSFEIIGLQDIGCTEELPETHDTIRENAQEKARYVYENYGVNCFSEDSGLEIDALNGEPGVHTAHYSGSRDADANMQLVLDKMAGVTHRSARFRTVIALILNGREYLFEGTAEGSILTEKRGNGGFGYDPIFVPTGYEHSFAEMSSDIKNQISHRAKATKALITFLNAI
ncbi:MAG: non-canonical purine NTP diphosphatase [Saprospiraceae bacterium]